MRSLVSIIIPAHNAERWLPETIESAIAQTWSRVEVIVVDDGSTDATLRVARRYESGRVTVLTQPNAGVSVARNTGFGVANGDFIQWLDADDLLHSDKVERQLHALRAQGPSHLATGPVGVFHFQTERARFSPSSLWQDLSPVEWMSARFADDAWIQLGGWLMPRSVVESAGPWDARLSLDEDGEYLTRVVARSKGVVFVPEARTYYRRGRTSSLSQRRDQMAMESLVLATEQSVEAFLTLQSSNSARAAAIKFLQHRRDHYDPRDVDHVARLQRIAVALGGELRETRGDWKLRLAGRVIGRSGARRMRGVSATAKTEFKRLIEWCGHRMRAR